MGTSELQLDTETDDPVAASIPPARTLWETAWESGRRSLPAGGSIAAAIVGIPLLAVSTPNHSYGPDATTIWERLIGLWDIQVNFLIPAAIAAICLVYLPFLLISLRKTWGLHFGGRLEVNDGTVRFWRVGLFGERLLFSEPIERVDFVQETPLQTAEATSLLPDDRNQEVTVVLEDDMHVVSRGLTETESGRLVEWLDECTA